MRRRIAAWCAAAVVAITLASAAAAAPIDIVYQDASGEGFFDPALGAVRRAAFEHAVDRWAATLGGSAPLVVAAGIDPLGGTGTNALLASAGPVTLHRNFAGGRPQTWYGAALANHLAGRDLNGADVPEIEITFNGDVDGPVVLGSLAWYYGLDAQPGVDVDFVTIALHELGHGLNFFESIDPTSGALLTEGDPGIFERLLERPGVGVFAELRNAERLAAIVSGELAWNGPNLQAFNGGAAAVYAPDPFLPGASLGHWATGFSPDELLEPFYTGAVHDFGLLLPALVDMGWELAVSTPTPRPPGATPTPAPTAWPTATPWSAAARSRELAYVTNFDDGTLSIIDTALNAVIDIATVGPGPIGVVAAPDGRRLYVANFQGGSLSVVDTRDNRERYRVPVGQSANGVAVTPDGSIVAVTDTAAGAVVLLPGAAGLPGVSVAAGAQPAAIALDASGARAFVTNFSARTVAVVDVGTRLRRAILPVAQDGLVGIALAPDSAVGVVTAFHGDAAVRLDTDQLRAVSPPIYQAENVEAVVLSRDGAAAYISSHAGDSGAGTVAFVQTLTRTVDARIAVGRVPEAMALSPDGGRLYVANAGSDSVSVIDTARRRVVATVPVGRAPMGVAVFAVPATCQGDCDGDGTVLVNELVTGVNIALGELAANACAALDADGNGEVVIAELIGAVGALLNGC